MKAIKQEGLKWELDGRETRFLFEAAKEKAAAGIERMRNEIDNLKKYEPIPQVYNPATGEFGQYDRKTKEDLLNQANAWLQYYEKIHRFCLKASDTVMHIEADRFGEQMKEMFKNK